MKKWVLGFGLLVLGFVALGTLAWAAPAGGGDRPAAPGLSFLFDKEAFSIVGSQPEPAGTGKISKLSLRLYGGYNHMLAGDVNDGSDYLFELIEAYEADGFGTVDGGYKPLHGGFNFGGDLIYQITPSLGIGIGAGYMRSSADSAATFTSIESVDLTASSALSAIPIRLGVFLAFPLGGRLDLVANAGAAYYAGLRLDAAQRLDWPTDGSWLEMSVAGSRRSGADIGFHGSLGVEYKLSPMMGLFVEAAGRYARFNNFETVTGIAEADSGTPGPPTEGKLYIGPGIFGSEGGADSFMVVETGVPVGPEYREPKFDLSGFSLQVGVRIHF